ncbi:MAG: DegT/DnrJ/EryC1/StrS family aminotransferase [Candidatus Acidiferrales bacterium]|jgi:dTDP-4-amino-4,6-dideoxygalactose transaminase
MNKSQMRVASIPFHRPAVGEDEVQAVANVIRSGMLTMGPRTLEFEKCFEDYVGAQHAVAVSSGTAALHLALEAAGIGPGDEVLVPTTTFTATAQAVAHTGARPVFCDIDSATLNMDPGDVRRRITAATRAILPVHLGGNPCEMTEILEIARQRNLSVIEDAAHALPSRYSGKLVGSISEFTCFSFYATKTLTTGEGGMITTDNEDAAGRMRLMRLHGIDRSGGNLSDNDGSWNYSIREAGYKYNFTDIQAALGIVQLAKCDAMRDARSRIARRYSEAFGAIDALEAPVVRENCESSWHLYILRLHLERFSADRDAFIDRMSEKGVTCSVHFIPLHLQDYYQRAYGYRAGDFPRAEAEFRRCVSLPIYPNLSGEEVEFIIDAVKETVAELHLPRSIAARG